MISYEIRVRKKKIKMAKYILIAAVVTLFAIPPFAQAEVYKWMDENGMVHYTQTPPRGVQARMVKPGKPPPQGAAEAARAKLEERLKASEERRKARAQTEEERTRAAENETIRNENCRLARQNLEVLQTHGQTSIKEGDTYRILAEEERQAKITEYQGYAEDYCGPA